LADKEYILIIEASDVHGRMEDLTEGSVAGDRES
jgi:hypothetical protein